MSSRAAGGIRGGVGEREADALEVVDAAAELHALGRPAQGQPEQSFHRAGAARADVDALLDEPLVAQLIGRADRPEPGGVRHADVLERELWMPVGERVRVVRIGRHPNARRLVVDEEQRRQASIAVGHMGVEDHEVGVVGAGDEPLLAVEDPLTGRPVANSAVADSVRGSEPAFGSVTA